MRQLLPTPDVRREPQLAAAVEPCLVEGVPVVVRRQRAPRVHVPVLTSEGAQATGSAQLAVLFALCKHIREGRWSLQLSQVWPT